MSLQAATGYVLVHRALGIYVGRSPASAYWSKLNAAGRNRVATFPSEAMARWHIEVWEGGWPDDSPLAELSLHQVRVDRPGGWASIEALRHAGLQDHLGELAHPAWAAANGHC